MSEETEFDRLRAIIMTLAFSSIVGWTLVGLLFIVAIGLTML